MVIRSFRIVYYVWRLFLFFPWGIEWIYSLLSPCNHPPCYIHWIWANFLRIDIDYSQPLCSNFMIKGMKYSIFLQVLTLGGPISKALSQKRKTWTIGNRLCKVIGVKKPLIFYSLNSYIQDRAPSTNETFILMEI